jgi:uncharacterized membrane protein
MLEATMMGGFGWLGMGFMWLWMLLPLAFIIGVGWLFAKAVEGHGGQRASDEAAAILRRRFVAGEIDAEQYAQARAALGLTDTP